MLTWNGRISLFLGLLLSLLSGHRLIAQCNGHAQLCNRPYNEVAFLTTHNAFNSAEDNFNLPNQNYNITRQLNDGVRGLMLDIYDASGTPVVYHGFAWLGSLPLSDVLDDIHDFMVANPNEIVTLILECYVDANTIESSLTASGLDSLLYSHTTGSTWPTLQTMISNNERLVVFSDVNDAGPGQDWYHYVWDFAVETDFSIHDTADFDCSFNRGSASNDLFILNHFVTDANLGVGLENEAVIANAYPYFYNRAVDCHAATGKFPNFPTVDFYDRGDVLLTVDLLNGVATNIDPGNEAQFHFEIFPNPGKNEVTITFPQQIKSTIFLYNMAGKEVMNQPIYDQAKAHLQLDGLPPGIYFIQAMGTVRKWVKF